MTAILEDQTREFQNCNPSKASSGQANFPRETGKQTSENLSQPQAELQGLQGHQSNDSGRPSKRIPERSSKCHFTKQTSPDRRHRVRILERHQAKLSCHNNRPIIPSKESWSTTYWNSTVRNLHIIDLISSGNWTAVTDARYLNTSRFQYQRARASRSQILSISSSSIVLPEQNPLKGWMQPDMALSNWVSSLPKCSVWCASTCSWNSICFWSRIDWNLRSVQLRARLRRSRFSPMYASTSVIRICKESTEMPK